METGTLSLVLVTVSGSHPSLSESWMLQNRCILVGDNAFLFYDAITIEQARGKLIGLVGSHAKVNAFQTGFPFLYQNNQLLERDMAKLFG